MFARTLFAFSPVLLLSACPAEDSAKPADTGDADTDTDSDSDADSDSDTDSGENNVSTASVSIINPTDGSLLYPGASVSWEATDFVADAGAVGGTDEDGHGHFHVYVDHGDYFATTDTSLYLDPAVYGPGEHTVEVHLASNSHNDLYDAGDEGARAVTTFTILAPSIAITAPTDASTTDSAGVNLQYIVTDFTMSEAVDGAPVVGEGHVHLMLDGIYYDLTTDPTGGWFQHLSPGKHTLGAMLVNNDHTELMADGPSAEITVDVPEDRGDITLNSPPGTDYGSATIPVSVTLENWTLDPENAGGTSEPGVGHYHIYLDGAYAELGTSLETAVRHVSAGEHTLEVRLANNDHTELAARDSVSFSVAADRPDVTITSPGDGETVSGDVYVMSTVENFTLSEDVGGANVAGEGHLHLFLDGAYYQISTDGQFLVSGLPSGEHTLTVGMVNNDHTDVNPMVYDWATITVP